MKQIRLVIVFAFSLALALPVLANNETDAKKALNDFHKKEKMRLTPSQIENFLQSKEYAKQYLNKKVDKYSEQMLSLESGYISQKSYPESELHAAVNPKSDNNIVVSPIRQNPNNMMKSLSCPVFYTKDGGQTWSESSFETFTLGDNGIPMGGGDPMFTFDADGTLYFSWIYLYANVQGMSVDSLKWGVFWAYSTDGGVTFQSEEHPIIGNALGAVPFNNGQPNLSEFHDKQWLAADMSSSQYRNNVYASLVAITQEDGYMMQLFTKEAGNRNFNYEPIRISPVGMDIVQFGSLDVDNKGWIHIMFYGSVSGDAAMYHAVSKDGGKSIAKVTKISNFYGTDPVQLAEDEENGIAKPTGLSRLYPAPNITVDKSGGEYDGYVYATWTAKGVNSDTKTGLDVYFTKSTDGGNTWADPIILNDNTSNMNTDQFYSAHMVNSNGVYAIAWYDRRDDANNISAHYYYAISTDGGKSFSENKPITNIPSNFNNIGGDNNGFGIGEYNQIILTKDNFIPIWGDGRSNDGNVNVMFAKEPLGSTGIATNFGTINTNIKLISISPMPIGERATIEIETVTADNYEISIYSLDGKKQFSLSQNLSAGNNSIDLNLDLAKGVYFIKISNDSSFVASQIVID